MPSSLIFVGLVVLWLLILVPTVARHRQEVARPSTAALSGRVLERPRPGGAARRRIEEVDEVAEPDEIADGAEERPADDSRDDDRGRPDRDDDRAGDEPGRRAGRDDEARDDEARDDDAGDDPGRGPGRETGDERESDWDRPAPRYRPGRGGFDPAAAALAARARYAYRQRVVVGLLVAAVVTAAAAVFLGTQLWWVHGVVDLVLLTYLVYLRRQVRMEAAIRDRRAARMAGTRRAAAAEDPQLDEWARRGRDASARFAEERGAGEAADDDTYEDTDDADDADDDPDHGRDRDAGLVARSGGATPDGRIVRDLGIGVVGTGVGGGTRAAMRPGGAAGGTAADGEPGGEPVDETSDEPALPRLHPVAPPPLPSGTAPLALEDLDPDLPAVDRHAARYRRAAGQ